MASLKTLKTRIGSISSTRKITHAMKVVSGTKLKKARQALDANRPYAEEVAALAEILLKQLPDKHDYPLLRQTENVKHCVLLVIGSEKGLCSSFNSGLVKAVKQKIAELRSSGTSVTMICVGAKIHTLLKHLPDIQVELEHENVQLLIKKAEVFVQNLIFKFIAGQFDSCFICYNKFVNAMKRDLIIRQFIPLHIETQSDHGEMGFEFEPEAEVMIQELVSYLMVGSLLSALFESRVSEDAARMTAMDNATRNASEMIKKLTTLYNRQRQAAVTTELTEIIAGAESVQ